MTALLNDSETVALRVTTDPNRLADVLSPLIRMELATIGAIEAAAGHESHPGYAVLFQDTKTSKQSSVEQMNTLLRLAGQTEITSGGLAEPVLRLQTLALQKASTTVLLQAMRLVEKLLLDRYAEAVKDLADLERQAIERASRRARKHWVILSAHIARRKDGEASIVDDLPHPLSHYFASDEDRVCMRCLLDRPGPKPVLERQDPYTFICAACHAEVAAEFPPDLQAELPRSPERALHDRVIHKALSRPMKLQAVKTVHTPLAGLPPEPPSKVAVMHKANPAEPPDTGLAPGANVSQPASELSIAAAGASAEEASFTTLLFDYRSVRNHW